MDDDTGSTPDDAPDGLQPADADDGERPAAPGLRVGRLLGRGGSSAVWLATDDDGRRLALKVLAPGAAGPTEGHPGERAAVQPRRGRHAATGAVPAGAAAPSPSSVAGWGADSGVLVRELRLLQRFTHDHLVRVHGVVETDQGPGLLMGLAPGGSLLGLVTSRGPLPIPEVVTALVPVAQALSYLHDAGAVHGDVTPANILFTAEGKPLLGDLGTARLLGARRAGVAGTPGFLDPLHDGSFDAGADVFALGAVAWFALTGRIPGPAEQRPPLALIVPEVPLGLMHLIEDALSSSRDRRPTAEEFARGLLAGSTPVPIDLVPAVHASVLPELLTRRVDPPPGAPPSGWVRLTGRGRRAGGGARGTMRGRRPGKALPRGPHGPAGRRAGGSQSAGRAWAERLRPDQLGVVRSRTERARGAGTPPASHRQAARVPRQRPRRARPGERRTREVLALLAGVAAVVLLVAGVALTVDGGGSVEPAAGTAPHTAPATPPGTDPATPPGTYPRTGPGAAPNAGMGRSPSDSGPGRAEPALSDPPVAAGGNGSPGPDRKEAAIVGSEAARAAQAGEPAAALGGLAALRAQAFAEADPDLLAMVDVEGSPAMAADREAVGALAETGRSLQDLSIGIRDAAALTAAELAGLPVLADLPAVADPPPATEVSVVRATATLSPYTETAAASAPHQYEPVPPRAAGQQELIFILWTSDDGWRIHSVVAPPT